MNHKETKNPLDVIPKRPQYSDTHYAPDFVCPECRKSGFMEFAGENPKSEPNVIGWADTPSGYVGIYECQFCGTKYRFHSASKNRFNKDDFEHDFVQYFARRCPNWYEEFGKKLGLDRLKIQM